MVDRGWRIYARMDPRGCARMAERVHCLPARRWGTLGPHSAKDEEAGMVETGRVAARGGEIAYHTAGDRPAVGYLHGAGGLRWGKALDPRATRFHVYALGLLGFGGSTLADDVNSIPDAADVV